MPRDTARNRAETSPPRRRSFTNGPPASDNARAAGVPDPLAALMATMPAFDATWGEIAARTGLPGDDGPKLAAALLMAPVAEIEALESRCLPDVLVITCAGMNAAAGAGFTDEAASDEFFRRLPRTRALFENLADQLGAEGMLNLANGFRAATGSAN